MINDVIDGVILDSDEDGFYLILSGQGAEYRFNIHGVACKLLAQSEAMIRPWWREMQSAAFALGKSASMTDEEARALLDPKHPKHHDVMADVGDTA